jgi:hypothetical protein
MPPILTTEHAVHRIAAERSHVDERGAVGIRLEPAAAIVRRYGQRFRRVPGRQDRSKRCSWHRSADAARLPPSGALQFCCSRPCRRPLLSRKSLPLAANDSSRICRQLPFAGLRANGWNRPFPDFPTNPRLSRMGRNWERNVRDYPSQNSMIAFCSASTLG